MRMKFEQGSYRHSMGGGLVRSSVLSVSGPSRWEASRRRLSPESSVKALWYGLNKALRGEVALGRVPRMRMGVFCIHAFRGGIDATHGK